MPDASALAAFTTASDSHVSDAPLAVNVRVTGPAATSGCEPNGIATTAPGVVVTVPGTCRLAVAAVTVAWVGAASDAVVDTLPPDAFESSTVSVVAAPV